MQYPINKPTIELRNIHLSNRTKASEFLDGAQVPISGDNGRPSIIRRKIKSQEQLDKELAEEERAFGRGADFGYCELGGYKDTHAMQPDSFASSRSNGVWWFHRSARHLYLSTGINGAAPDLAGAARRHRSQPTSLRTAPRRRWIRGASH